MKTRTLISNFIRRQADNEAAVLILSADNTYLAPLREVIPFTRNSFSLRLDDPSNTTIPLSKSAASELQTL